MKRILVVDDNEDILDVVKIILSANGFKVMVTPKGEETFDRTESFSPQLILLDVFLQGIDGREICKELKSNPQTQGIPVIMFSAHDKYDEIEKICKPDDFIAKPFDVAELVNKINAQVSSNEFMN